jgi:hypothetical protein
LPGQQLFSLISASADQPGIWSTVLSLSLRPFFALLESACHIGAAVRAAEEFECARGHRQSDAATAASTSAIPL